MQNNLIDSASSAAQKKLTYIINTYGYNISPDTLSDSDFRQLQAEIADYIGRTAAYTDTTQFSTRFFQKDTLNKQISNYFQEVINHISTTQDKKKFQKAVKEYSGNLLKTIRNKYKEFKNLTSDHNSDKYLIRT
jgi:hypothetical protein